MIKKTLELEFWFFLVTNIFMFQNKRLNKITHESYYQN